MYQFHKLKIKNIQTQSDDAVIWTLNVADDGKELFNWQAGQHLIFRKNINDKEIRRSYSIFSPRKDKELRVLIKKVVDGQFSQAAQTEYVIGQSVEVMPPSGHFVLTPQDDKAYAFFAAGSGITPILGMIYEVLHSSNSSVNLYYGNTTVASTLLKQQLSDLKDEYPTRLSISYFLSQEPVDIELFAGRIDADKVTKIFNKELQQLDIASYFLCGPGDMTAEITQVLIARGVKKDIIHSELFLSAGQVITAKQKTSKLDSGVMVKIDGITSHYEIKQGDEKTLLDAALDANIDMPYSCQAGVCATCRCKLVDGEVEMLNNYSLEDWELEGGYILSCQSIPKSKKISLDYDS
ncbi:Phenylacetate-CoA oxygenase/reductase, PaaK subunit [hydrothermal vent metagenome]|uniref:Phenylacetate-CoA oxygenase/reductase, PaaK subunit n=1 Tax=hydrothermal vent metagenome TaxID=652676 RepID=A0A3B0VBH7_9ZZZZ